MTTKSVEGSISTGSTRGATDVVRILLRRLVDGQPTVLAVMDSRMPKRKRLPRLPMLFLTPMSLYFPEDTRVVAALETHGCEVFDPKTVDFMTFYRLGINARLSRAMATELNRLFTK